MMNLIIINMINVECFYLEKPTLKHEFDTTKRGVGLIPLILQLNMISMMNAIKIYPIESNK